MEVEQSTDLIAKDKPRTRAPYRRRASLRVQSITEEMNKPADPVNNNTNDSESMDQEDDSLVKRRCSLRPRRSVSASNIVQVDKTNPDPPRSISCDNLVLPSSISKIKSRHSTLETIFEEPLENGIRLFSKTKSKRSLVLNGNITKMKIKQRKTKVKKMNLQKTIKRLKNKITFDELQKKLNTLGLGL